VPSRTLTLTLTTALAVLVTALPAAAAAVKGADPLTLLRFPQNATVTAFDDTFGYSRAEGHRHLGNDLIAPKHSPVYAVAAGVVARMGKSPRAGAYLVIEHGGWQSHLMHLNNDRPGTDDGRAAPDQTWAPGLEVGAHVAAGQLVGFVGDSGNAEGTLSHTHVEIHVGGRAIDPYPYLIAAQRRALAARLGRIIAQTA
jgi:murein DD-endopeptidase MepM/ murein hydrolase activator NlpD